MGKYFFNEVFKEIVETYYLDSTVLGNMTDRDPSRIRHYKSDSKPGKAVLEQLITSICSVIADTNDPYVNSILIDKLNRMVKNSRLFTSDIYVKLSDMRDILIYVPFILRRSLEISTAAKRPRKTGSNHYLDTRGVMTKVSQGHNLFVNNLYQDAVRLYEELLNNPVLSELPEQELTIHTDLGLIYRSEGIYKYNPDTLKLAAHHFDLSSQLALALSDLQGNAVINKYLGTVYMSLSVFEAAEPNLKKAASYYDLALSALDKDQEEYSRVMINYGTLFIHYANIRSTRNFMRNAISYFEHAISFYKDANNYFKAMAYLHSSLAYSALSEISNAQENAGNAIRMVNQALEIYTIEDHPLLYAQCISNLGHIHLMMAVYNNTVENCNKAVNYIHHVLNVCDENVDTYTYWVSNLNLTALYILLSNYTKDYSYLDKAAECLEECQKHNLTRDNSINTIKADLNHAEVLIGMAAAKKDNSMIDKAMKILDSTLAVTHRMEYETITAMAEDIYAKAYYNRFQMTKEASDLDELLIHAGRALKIFTINEYPLCYGTTSHLVAKAYREKGDVLRSKREYEGLFNIFTKEKYTEKHMQLLDEYNALE